jgi:hypothetical protein
MSRSGIDQLGGGQWLPVALPRMHGDVVGPTREAIA